MKYSRRKYGESVRYLKSAIAHDGLSHAFRRRCVELLLAIYGVPVAEAGDSHLTKKSVKELVQTRSVDKVIRQGVRESVAEREAREAAEAEQQAETDMDALLKNFLKPTETESVGDSTGADAAKEVMQTPTQKEGHGEQSWLHQLAIAGDLGATRDARVAAIRWIQTQLSLGHPVRSRNADDLLREMRDPWDKRLFPDRSGAGYFESQVLRPAQDILDLW